MATFRYVTLGPVTYVEEGQVKHVTKAGVIINLDSVQAAALEGSISYVSGGLQVSDLPRITVLRYESLGDFPATGNEAYLYLDEANSALYEWSDELGDYSQTVSLTAPDNGTITVAKFDDDTLVTSGDDLEDHNDDESIATVAAILEHGEANWAGTAATVADLSDATNYAKTLLTSIDDAAEAREYLEISDAAYAQVVPAPTGVAATDTAAIQAAHDALPAAGGEIRLGAGVYALTNPGPTFTKKVHLVGIGPGDANLAGGTTLWSNSTSAVGLTIDPATSWPTGTATIIENISFVNNDALTPASGVGLRITDASECLVRRCSFFNHYDHVSVESGQAFTFQNCVFNTPKRYAIRLRNLDDADTGDGLIESCFFIPFGGGSDPTAAIRWESGAGLRIVNNKFNQGAHQWGIAIDAAFQGDSKDTGGLFIQNNSIENVGTTGIKLSRITGSFITVLTQIQNNEFQSISKAIELGTGWTEVIVSGNIGRSVATPIDSAGATKVTQANNQWNGLNSPTAIKDANNNTIIDISQPAASAVNALGTWNGATGQPVYILPMGSDTDIGLVMMPKGGSGVYVMDANFALIAEFYGVASAVNNLQFYNQAAGGAPGIVASGASADVGINLIPKGAGRVQENGNTVGSWVAVPSTPTSTGKVGQMAADTTHLYTCVAANTWRRVAHGTW